MTAIWSIGECMLELKSEQPDSYRRAFAGDTYNTAVYLKRALPDRAVDYVSALGEDPVSAAMRLAWREQGVGDRHCRTVVGRLPGIYLIQLDSAGERSFFYWREASAARAMLDPQHAEALTAALPGCGMIYFSGISLAILDAGRRTTLYALLEAAKAQGVSVVFDPNVRRALWPDEVTAREEILKAGRLADIVLPTADDMPMLGLSADPAAVAEAFGASGVDSQKRREIVVKLGSRGVEVFAGGERQHAAGQVVERPLDTTAAGDAFNAGYLAARLSEKDIQAAAALGNALAAQVIQAPGAIVPQEVTAPVLEQALRA